MENNSLKDRVPYCELGLTELSKVTSKPVRLISFRSAITNNTSSLLDLDSPATTLPF